MADTSIYSELANAIPVVVGGMLALAGGVIGHFITDRLTTRRERDTLRHERLESLVKALYAHVRWMHEMRIALVMRKAEYDTPSPLDEANMIQSLHFPELNDELQAVQKAEIPYTLCIIEERLARSKNEDAWLTAEYAERFEGYYMNYNKAVGAVTKKCREVLYPQS